MAFTLCVYESEFKEIQQSVSLFENIETGGDLFGLWKRNGDPVVQLVTGPGQKCRRTSVSFHQDTVYLARVGEYLNSTYMLCHVGSWHSHHQLSLSHPSAGDCSSVCNNFPVGLQRYIMIIANIRRGKVEISPYMFTEGGHVCKKGVVCVVGKGSPFRENGYVIRCLSDGSEHPIANGRKYVDKAPTEYQVRPSMHHNSLSARSDASRDDSPMDVDSSDDELRTPFFHGLPMKNPNQTHLNQSNLKADSKLIQWYNTDEGNDILKLTYQDVKKHLGHHIDIHRKIRSKNLVMKLWHNNQEWIVEFPPLFDSEPALIMNTRNGKSVHSKNIVECVRELCQCGMCKSCSPLHMERVSRQSSVIESPNNRKLSGKNQSPRKMIKDRRNKPYSQQSSRQPLYNTNDSKFSGHLTCRTRSGKCERSPNFFSSPYDVPKVLEQRFSPQRTPKVGRARPSPRTLFSHATGLESTLPQQAWNRHGININHRSHLDCSPAENKSEFFANDGVEKKFSKLCNEIRIQLADQRKVEIRRSIHTKEIYVTFFHNSKKWKVTFPPRYPEVTAEIYCESTLLAQEQSDDVIINIRKHCKCRVCRYYT